MRATSLAEQEGVDRTRIFCDSVYSKAVDAPEPEPEKDGVATSSIATGLSSIARAEFVLIFVKPVFDVGTLHRTFILKLKNAHEWSFVRSVNSYPAVHLRKHAMAHDEIQQIAVLKNRLVQHSNKKTRCF